MPKDTRGDSGLRAFLQQAFVLLFGLCLLTVPPSAVGAADEPEKPDPRIIERDSLWQQAQQLATDGKLAESIKLGKQVLKIEQTVFGDVHQELAGTLLWLSQRYLALQQMPQTVDYASHYHGVTEKLHGKDHWQTVSARWYTDNVRKLQAAPTDSVTAMLAIEARYNELFAAEEYAAAAAELEKLIPYELDMLGTEHPFLANTWANQADCWLNADQYSQAERAARKAAEIRLKILGDNHPDTATATWYLAKALIFQDKHEDALEPLKQAASIWRATEQPVDAAWMDSWRGDSLAALNRKPEATEAYRAALTAFRDVAHAEGEAVQRQRLVNLDGRNRLWKEALAARKQGRLDNAAMLGERVLAIEKVWLGDEHAEAIATLEWLAGVYEAAGNWSSAIAGREAVVVHLTATDGESHWRTIDARLAVKHAHTLSELTDAQRAELAEASDLIQQGLKAWRAGEFAIALQQTIAAREIRGRLLGEEHPEYATTLGNIAQLYKSLGDYAGAEPLNLQCQRIRKKVLGEEHPSYATTLNNMASFYQTLGDYARAEHLYLQCQRIQKRVLGTEHSEYAASLNNMAQLYKSMGDYARAEPLYLQCRQIQKRVLGEEHPEYAALLGNIADLYQTLGDYARAEPLYLQCRDIRKKVLGEEHPDYATTLNGMALFYKTMGDYARAEPLYLQCLQIQKNVLGEEHPNYATTLGNIARVYETIGDNARAELLHLQCLQIQKNVLGEEHPDYVTSLNNMAMFYETMGDYARAEPLYLQCREIQKNVLGEEHPNYATTLNNMAGLYHALRQSTQAEAFASASLSLTRSLLEKSSIIQSERQQLAMNQMLRYRLDSYLSLALDNPEFQAKAAREVLQWKGATLVRQRAMRQAAEEPAISARFAELQQVSRQLASLSRATPSGDPDTWKQRITDLTADKERLEAQLSRDSATFRSAMQQVTPEQIQAAIPADAVLIDFLQFSRSRPAEKKGQWDYTTSLLAVIVQHNGDPLLIELGPVAPLSASIDTWRQTFGMSPQGKAAGMSIRQQIWEPLLEHIADAKTVLVSADGVLGRLPLAALPGKEPGKYLIEDHHMAMIPVPQLLPALVNDLGTKALSRELLLLGDVDYDAEPAAPEEPKRKKRRPGKSENRADLIDSVFQPLSGAAGEIAAIQVLYSDLFEPEETDVFTLKRAAATKAAFREAAGQYRHLHLATHGFFASADHLSAIAESTIQSTADRAQLVTRDSSVVGWNPGLLSGLALSGANLEPEPGKEDGILTSQEIAFLPLNGVDTVVLSACETGLGEVAGGEGLIGIQRAFQISGARTTVASFWKVNDEVTRRLMERFYRNLWENERSRLDALREAQLYILNNPDSIRGGTVKGQESTQRVPPYYWAAFQLSGDWR